MYSGGLLIPYCSYSRVHRIIFAWVLREQTGCRQPTLPIWYTIYYIRYRSRVPSSLSSGFVFLAFASAFLQS